MTMQADRSPPKDADDRSGDGSRGTAGSPSATDAGRNDPDGTAGQKPELSEAIDRATAAVGQDDGKR